MNDVSDGLDQLRTHTKMAAKELGRLKNENAQLSETLKEIWDSQKELDGTSIIVDVERDVLITKVKSYINTINRVLQENA